MMEEMVLNALLKAGFPKRKADEIVKNEYYYLYNDKSLFKIAKRIYFERTHAASIEDDEMDEIGIEVTYNELKESGLFFRLEDGCYFEVAGFYQYEE